MRVCCFEVVPPANVVDRCVEVYAAAFGQPPYFETADRAEELRDRLDRYQTRNGFVVPVLRDSGGQVQGFALAVTAHPGDWWRERAAAALDRAQAYRWLGNACLEVVHVAVHPDCQRRGYGRHLMRVLETGSGAGTGALSCHPQAIGAQQLYLSEGWQVLTRNFRTTPGQLGYWLMAKDLTNSR